MVVHRRAFLDRLDTGLLRLTRHLRVQDLLPRKNHVVGGQRLAVLPGESRLHPHGEHRVVRRLLVKLDDLLVRTPSHLLVKDEQADIQLVHHSEFVHRGYEERVQRGRAAVQVQIQRLVGGDLGHILRRRLEQFRRIDQRIILRVIRGRRALVRRRRSSAAGRRYHHTHRQQNHAQTHPRSDHRSTPRLTHCCSNRDLNVPLRIDVFRFLSRS